MKFNIRKITSVIASAVMLSSTIGFAAAASYPQPFVKTGAADAAIVVGSDLDMAGAVDLQTKLNALVTSKTGTTTVTGESVKIEKSKDSFNLGDNINNFYTTLDDEELSTVLAAGTYENSANDEFDYDQAISLNPLNLSYFQSNDFNNEKPAIGFELTNDNTILTYTLDFNDPAETGSKGWTSGNDLESTDITILGKSYYILSARNSSGYVLTLLDSANTAVVSEGEVSTVTVGDQKYQINALVSASDKTTLTVDGITKTNLAEGDSFKIGADTYVAVKNIMYSSKESGISKVEVSIGSGKLTLKNGTEVEMNGEKVSSKKYSIVNSDEEVTGIVTPTIDADADSLNKITLVWELNSNFWMSEGGELVMPGFESIKLSMGGFNVPAQEVTEIDSNGDTSARISTTLEDGKISLDFLSLNESQSEFDGIGKDNRNVLSTTSTADAFNVTLNETQRTMFPVTWVNGKDFESAVYQIDGIEENTNTNQNKTTIKNVVSGKTYSLSEIGKTTDIGSVRFTLIASDDKAKAATVQVSSSGSSGNIYGDRLVTDKGLQFRLPVQVTNKAVPTGDGQIFLGNSTDKAQASWVMNFTEEDKDGNIGKGESFTATIAADEDDGAKVNAISPSYFETEDNSKIYEGYIYSDLATKLSWDKNPDLYELTISYAGEESSADVYISESGAALTSGTEGSAIKVIKDTEVASVGAKNLIVVGGSCVNSVAAKLLGSESALCGADFTNAAGVGVGGYLIKVFASPYAAADSGKVAMLVAGYETAQTTSAVADVIDGFENADVVGTKVVGPVLSSA